MLLNENEIQDSLKLARTAFPHFADWKYNNEIRDAYCGFALWGELIQERSPNNPMRRHFFVTFDTFEASWRGHLTIGQHNYYWSSTDFGDADLLDTCPCATLDEAITALKMGIADLFAEFSDGLSIEKERRMR